MHNSCDCGVKPLILVIGDKSLNYGYSNKYMICCNHCGRNHASTWLNRTLIEIDGVSYERTMIQMTQCASETTDGYVLLTTLAHILGLKSPSIAMLYVHCSLSYLVTQYNVVFTNILLVVAHILYVHVEKSTQYAAN